MNKLSKSWMRFLQSGFGIICMTIAIAPGSGFAQESHFGQLAVSSDQTSGRLRGTTGGKTSLPAIVSNRDHKNNKCLGFADPTPDHLLILKENLPSLNIRIKSGGADTTLVIQGPDGIIRCGDDTGSQKDASITDTNWKEGLYKVWVGTTDPGVQQDYLLTVQP